jgi:streptogramin lyase
MTNGLVSNEIKSVVQDRTGYLWIASSNGLQRFDGVHYKTFLHVDGDPTTIPVNNIEQLLVDNDDNLWILSTDGQAGIFDKRRFVYSGTAVQVQRPASLWALKRLQKDDQGNIFYLLQNAELLVFDKKKKSFINASRFFPIKPDLKISGFIHRPGTTHYWFGLEKGIAIYNRKTGILSTAANNIEKEVAVDSLLHFEGLADFHFDNFGRLWTMNWAGRHFPQAIWFDPSAKGKKVRTYEFLSTLKSYHEIHGYVSQDDGSVWIRGNGIFGKFNESEHKFELIPSDSRTGLGVMYDIVTTMYEDEEKNVWVGTNNFGLYRFNPSQQYFKNITHKNPLQGTEGHGSVMSFIELRNGDILAGAWSDGLFRYNSRLEEKPLNFQVVGNDRVTSPWDMCYSADSNTVWIASQPGLFQYDVAKGVMYYKNPAALLGRTIRQVVEDKQGNLWLGMQSIGLYKWVNPKGKKDSVVRIPGIGNGIITKVMADTKGYIWVTSERHGVYAYESATGQVRFHWNNRAPADSNKIIEGFSNVLEYNDSSVLISTATKIYHFNRRTNMLSQMQLPAPLLGSIASMEQDNAGFLWISTSNGLYRYNPFTRVLIFFNREDGIINDHFIFSASYKRRNGSLLFGADYSFIHFNPAAVTFPNGGQKVVLTGLQIGRREIPVDSVLQLDLLTLSPGENSMTVQFSSLTYTAYSVIQYKLEGIDKEWHTADKDNKAAFPFLPPGRYRLLLRTINVDGLPSEPTVLQIYIQSPFYQTWWFYSVLAVMLAVLLYWLDRQRTKRKAVLQKVRTDIADGLHQEVNTALNNINILSEIARLKAEREPQKAREYLEQIHDKSHNMIIALDDMLWSLDPENDAVEKTITRIREFADALMQRSGAVIELLIDKKVERLQLNMKLRHEAFLLFKEGLRSLIDAGTKNCIVHLTAERGKLLFTIEFENEHCDMQKLNNLLQRRDMEERIHALNAKLDVQVHKSRSIFLLQLTL